MLHARVPFVQGETVREALAPAFHGFPRNRARVCTIIFSKVGVCVHVLYRLCVAHIAWLVHAFLLE